jgi:O-antigen ligase
MVVTSTLTGLLLGLHGVARLLFPAGQGRSHPAGWIFLPFLAYAAMNVLWVTPVRWLGWHDWLWWTQMLIIFWVVLNDMRSGAAQRALLIVLGSLGFTAVVLAAYQTFVQPDWLMLGRQQAEQFAGRASGPFGIPNSLAALLLVLLPPAVVLTFSPRAGAVRRILAGYLACAYIFGLALTVSRGAWLGLAVAVVVWPLLQGGENWRRRVGRTLVAGLAVLAAGVVIYLTVPTLRARFETLVEEAGERTRPIMWRGAWQLFQENPVFGSGAGSYNVAFERHRPEHYQLDSQWAHNDYLNTLSDYGIVGFGLFFGGAALVAFLALRRRASALLAPARVAGDGLDMTGTRDWGRGEC